MTDFRFKKSIILKNYIYLHHKNFADVAKLVDALDLGSSAFGHEGSSPSVRTETPLNNQVIGVSGFFEYSLMNLKD